MPITGQDVVNVLALLALVLSAFSLYLQYKVKGPLIELLNVEDVQRHAPRPHKDLPKDIQEKFPYIPDAQSGYALVKLIFGNSGDRVGIANIQHVNAEKIKGVHNHKETIKTSCDKYILVPAYAIVETEILLSNIEIGPNRVELDVELTIEYGGYNPDSTEYTQQGTIQKSIPVNLVPGNENPWLMY